VRRKLRIHFPTTLAKIIGMLIFQVRSQETKRRVLLLRPAFASNGNYDINFLCGYAGA
jgi:hypothetical protein